MRSGRARPVDVENAASLGMCERPDAVIGREPRERRRRRAAAAQDHERDPAWQRDQHLRAGALGRAYEPDGASVDPFCLERGPQHPVDQLRRRSERGAARAQHDRVEALQHLRATSSATPGLASKLAPIVPTGMRSSRTCSPFGERPARDLPLERLELRRRLELARERRDAALVEAEPVQRALVEACPRRRRRLARSQRAPLRHAPRAAVPRAEVPAPTAASVSVGSAAAAATASRSTSSRIMLYFVHW